VTVGLTNVNEAPVVSDQGFSLAENSANGTVVGTVIASDVDAADTRSYAITGGNTGGAFAINPATGEISVANAAALDYETTPSFALTVQVTDGGGLTDTATVTVGLTNVNEAPVVADQGFTAAENSANGTVVGTVASSDVDAGDTRSYAITGGNTGGAFTINPISGALSVANTAALDFETTPSFTLTVQVTDAGGLVQTSTVSVDLADIAEGEGLVVAVRLEDPPARDEDPTPNPVPTEELEAAKPRPRLAIVPLPDEPGGSTNVPFAKQLGATPRVWHLPEIGPSGGTDGTSVDRHLVDSQGRPVAIDQRRLLEALERLREDLHRDPQRAEQETLTITVEGVALAISGGLLALLMRGGSLAAAALSSVPLWRRVDPLAVLSLSEEERWQREQEIRAAQREEEGGRLLDAPVAEPGSSEPTKRRLPGEQ
jgi:hypothetical protein